MAKPSAAIHTRRPSTRRSSSSSTSSDAAAASNLPVTAAPHRDSASNAKVVPKCLVCDDDYFTLPSIAEDVPATQEEARLAPLLELLDPDVVSAAADNVLNASADSCVTEVPACADSTTHTEDAAAALPVEIINHTLEELRGAGGLSLRSRRFLAALAEAAALELAPAAVTTTTAASRARLRRTGFWGKVRVTVLAATLAALVAADIAVAAYLYARHASERYGHVMLPPT